MAKASIFGRHADWIVTAAVAAVLVVVIEYGLGGLDVSARTALLIFALAVVGWAGPFDNTFVALTAAVVMALAVAGSPDDLFRALGDNIIWLLVAAFIFAAAFRKSGLADLMAQKAAARARSVRAMFYSLAGVMVGSAFVIPSTSGRAAIMLPIFGAVTEGVHPRIRVAFALLMPTVILLSAFGSLIGAGAHIVALELLMRITGESLSFAYWALLCLPFAVLNTVIAIELILALFLTREERGTRLTPIAANTTETKIWSQPTIWVMALVLFGWFTAPWHGINETLIAVIGALLISMPRFGAIGFKEALKEVDWNLLVFLAATNSLAQAMVRTGLGVFTNVLREKDPTIKITKLTNPDDITGKFPFKIVNSFREIVASSTIDTSVNNMVKFTVPTETYSVLETVPEGWQLAEKGCELNGRDVGDQTSNGVSGIKLGSGDELECVFVDRREMGRIVVKKKTIGGNDDFDFILSGTSLSGTSFQLSNGDSREFELVTGSYTIAEDNLPDGWTLKNADCGGVGNQDGDKISVDLNGDETITCTFTNFKEVDGRMEDVVKVFINRRVNNLLDHGPDRARILNRLNQQQPLPSLKDTPPLKYSGTDVSTLTSGTAFGVASGTAAVPGIGSSSSVIGQSSSGIGGTASGSLPFGLSGDLSNGIPTGKFAFSLSEMREKAYSKEAAKIANAKSFSGLAFGGNPYGVDYGAIPTTLTPQRQDVWVEGHYSHYNDGTGGINRDGNFGIVYIGTDYSVTDTFLIGALVQFDWTDEDVRDADLTGNVDGWGWMVGPYIGAKLSPNLYFSARAAWGQSSNDINLTDDAAGYRTGSFDTDRWLATAELTGNWYHNGVRITPSAEIAYGTENQDAFRNSLGQRVGSNEATVGQLTFGPEFGFRNVRGDGTVVEPIVSIEGVWTFDDGDLVLSDGTVVGNEELTGRVEAGLLVQRPNGWAYRVTGDYNGIGDGDFESYGVRAWLNIPLN